ncbi:MAG: hypothetical protein QGH82_06850 [Candidatus Woesearchaeota archaeon]|nr:hypothetical protein [Candidatus Woesearchaeota archaeon]
MNDTTPEELREFIQNCIIEPDPKTGCDFIDDGAHGYLVVRPDHKHYADAVKIGSNAYSYTLPDGSVLLEEDCDAPRFAELIKRVETY